MANDHEDVSKFKAIRGLTFGRLKSTDRKLFDSLTNYFCPTRKSLEKITEIRNNCIAHVASPRFKENVFEDMWQQMKISVLEIAEATNSKPETQGIIDSKKVSPIDFRMWQLWLSDLVRGMEQNQEIKAVLNKIEEKMDQNHQQVSSKFKECKENQSKVLNGVDQINSKLDMFLQRQSVSVAGERNAIQNRNSIMCQTIPKVLIKEVSSVIQKACLGMDGYIARSIEMTVHCKKSHSNSVEKDQKDEEISDENEDADDNDKDTEETPDKHTCGKCDNEFYSLDEFIKHKVACTAVRQKKKQNILVGADRKPVTSETCQVRITVRASDTTLMESLTNSALKNPENLGDENNTIDFGECGSLVLWTKMPSKIAEEDLSLHQNVDSFVRNMVDKCSFRIEKETTLNVTVDIMQETGELDGDTLMCGRCKKICYTIESFCTHKRMCNKRRTRRHAKIVARDPAKVKTTDLSQQGKTYDQPSPTTTIETCTDNASIENRKARVQTCTPTSPTEITLSLYEDEYHYYSSKLQNTETADSGSDVLRQLRKKKKKSKFQPFDIGRGKTEIEATSSYESEISSTGSMTDVSIVSESTDSGIEVRHRRGKPKTALHTATKKTQQIRRYYSSDESDDESISQDYNSDDTDDGDYFKGSDIGCQSVTTETETNFSNLDETYCDKSFYERSKEKSVKSQIDENTLFKYGLDLSEDCVNNLSSRLKRKQKSYYDSFIDDLSKLTYLYTNEPFKYKRGVIQIEASHNAKCILSDEQNPSNISVVEISGRSKCGKAYTDDEVIVEILGQDTEIKHVIRMNKEKLPGKTFGKVVGVLKRHRCELMKYPVFICEIDEHEMDKAKPICKTMPKIHLVRKDNEGKSFSVDIFKYNKKDRNLKFKKNMEINKHLLKSFLFYVVCLSWDNLQYPVGVIFHVHESTQNYANSMKILDLIYKVPSVYGDKVVNLVEGIENEFSLQSKANRFNLTHLEVFTIDPEKSTVFDDALSIRELTGGEYEVGVHITDVASVVQIGSELDKDAWQRGTTFFPGMFLKPRQMLPEPISENICCLLPGEDRFALTVFLQFNSKKEIIFERTRFCKSIVRSHAKLSYQEVQKIIEKKEQSHRFGNQIRTLHEISKVSRKKRLGNTAYSMPVEINLPGEGDEYSIDAYNLIEEFMIVTNYMVAILLKNHFPSCVPLRCQDPPALEKVQEWLNAYPNIPDIIVGLQGKYLNSQRRLTMTNINQTARNDILPVQKRVWKSFIYSVRDKEFKMARNILASDELHPWQALALSDWEHFQETAVYRCSGNILRQEEQHFSLSLFPYVHFTAPIRRYIDIVAQRLFHAAVDKQPQSVEYNKDNVTAICNYVNNVSKNANVYRSRCKELVLATLLTKKPFMTYGFVRDFSEDEIHVIVPGLKFVQAGVMVIPLNILHLSSAPETKRDLDNIRMTVEKNCLELKWRKRIYSVTEKPPRAKTPSLGYQRSDTEYQKLHPHQNADHEKLTAWVSYLRLLLSGATSSQLSTKLNLKTLMAENPRNRYIHSQFKAELDINSELNKPDIGENEDSQAMFPDQYCKYSFSFHYGQILAIQFSSEMKNGLLTPTLEFFDMTKSIKCCLKHMRDPVSCFESYSTTKTQDVYNTSQEYKETWNPIILMEASYSVIRDSGITINDIYIRFEKDRGYFALKTGFCFERCIDIGLITGAFLERDISRRSSGDLSCAGDYLCIRCPIPYGDNEHYLGENIHGSNYYWLGHAKITKILKVNKGEPKEKIRVFFQLVKDDVVPVEIRYKDTGVKCSIVLLQRIESEKRVQVALDYLNKSDLLAKAIALNKRPPELDQKFVEAIKKSDIEIGLQPNNTMQNKAIQTALRSSFSLIHGPPGTGKTNTGIKLIHLFHELNKTHEDDGNKILFCGPSNKSVDLVAKRFMKYSTKHGPSIVRFYGSSVEQLVVDIPGKLISYQRGIEYKPDSDMDAISVHKLIRTSGDHAEEILRFETEFKLKPRSVTANKVKEYQKLLKTATIEELAKHDVIFSTTSMTTSPRLLQAVGNNVFQLIVDECGMCTEPECISSIVALKPKQVVLIGDHKQLRPVVMCKQAAELGLDKSLFERYSKTLKFVQLNLQYRMHESICKFPSEQFYDGTLQTAESPSYKEDPRLSIWLDKHGRHRPERHIFCHIEGVELFSQVSTESENERSCSNKEEVDQVIKIVKHLYYVDKIFKKGTQSSSLNIMSQYNAQCKEIKEALVKENLPHDDIHTVVSSQGGEWDYVIFSLVRSLPDYRIEPHPTKGWCKENLGFITDHNQINVALTRAKKGLFLIGNKHLLRCEKLWKALIEAYDARGCVVEGKDFPLSIRSRAQKAKTKSN